MAHSDYQEAGDDSMNDMDRAALAFEAFEAGEGPQHENPEQEIDPEDDPEEGVDGELELDDNEEAEGEEQGNAPAIEAPASLNAEEKAQFAQLPKEAQRLITEVESRRNGQVQAATTKAAEAQRQADARAARADAEAKADYARKLTAFADQLAPQMPDPRLAQADPASYIALKAQYDADLAQHQQFVQQVQSMSQEADSQMSEADIQQRDSELMQIPEVQNPETREAFFKRAIDTGNMLGLDMSQIQHATAKELKALREIADWKEKADKYETAMAKQMQRVREGKKANTAKPNAAPVGRQERGLRDAKARLRQSGSLEDAAAALGRLR